MVYRFALWGRAYLDETKKVTLFPAKAMVFAMVVMFLIQSIGLGFGYVFRDGENGEKRSMKVLHSKVLSGMYTTPLNAETLDELCVFVTEHETEYKGKELILYGNIPGLSYYLDRAPAVSTTWPDLASSSKEQLIEDLAQISGRPLVILTPELENKDTAEDEKLLAIMQFIDKNGYTRVFENEAFVLYE